GPLTGAAKSRPPAPQSRAAPPSLKSRRRISFIVELRRSEQDGVPFLLRIGLIESPASVRGEKRFDGLEVQAIRELREARGGGGAAVLGREQRRVACADAAR